MSKKIATKLRLFFWRNTAKILQNHLRKIFTIFGLDPQEVQFQDQKPGELSADQLAPMNKLLKEIRAMIPEFSENGELLLDEKYNKFIRSSKIDRLHALEAEKYIASMAKKQCSLEYQMFSEKTQIKKVKERSPANVLNEGKVQEIFGYLQEIIKHLNQFKENRIFFLKCLMGEENFENIGIERSGEERSWYQSV